jgi:hypothetical protein
MPLGCTRFRIRGGFIGVLWLAFSRLVSFPLRWNNSVEKEEWRDGCSAKRNRNKASVEPEKAHRVEKAARSPVFAACARPVYLVSGIPDPFRILEQLLLV